MWISKAYAQANDVAMEAAAALPEAPSAGEAFMWNMGLVLVLVVLFYVLLIAPQQRRLREHSEMLQELKKGDKVVTGGGLVGKIDKIKPGEPEVVVDLGNGVKVTAMRSTLQGKSDAILKYAPANDAKKQDDGKKADVEETSEGKADEKAKAPKKKAAPKKTAAAKDTKKNTKKA